ncbi:hypothetical protein ACFQY4_42650 [Catellatospora bangladeshensis]|uniref:hypothetical protein n=1 Tax=Catellatospora bangladeshensis TaxID=310355 RepID=UPI003606AC5D
MPRLVRDLPTWLIYLMLALWGYFNYGFGPVVPLLRDEQGTSAAMAGLHSTAIAAGAVAGGALYPVLSRRYGRGPVLWVCQAVIAAGVLGFVFLPALFPVTIALTALIAVAGIAAIGGIVSALSEQHGPAGPAAISEANAAACAAGLIAPWSSARRCARGWAGAPAWACWSCSSPWSRPSPSSSGCASRLVSRSASRPRPPRPWTSRRPAPCWAGPGRGRRCPGRTGWPGA